MKQTRPNQDNRLSEQVFNIIENNLRTNNFSKPKEEAQREPSVNSIKHLEKKFSQFCEQDFLKVTVDDACGYLDKIPTAREQEEERREG